MPEATNTPTTPASITRRRHVLSACGAFDIREHSNPTATDPTLPPPVSATTRRTLFGTMGTMLLLTAAEAGTSKAAELDRELLNAIAKAASLERQAYALAASVEDFKPGPLWDRHEALIDESCDLLEHAAPLPARTPEGMQAKAGVILARYLAEDGIAQEFACSLARDVLGRASA